MAENDQSAEKSHDPTPKRLEDARRRGDVARSDEVTVLAAYLGLLVATAASGSMLIGAGGGALAAFLDRADGLAGIDLGPGGFAAIGSILADIAWAFAPLFLLPMAFALISLVAQRAIVFAPDKIMPKLSHISPLNQLKQKFGATGLVEFLKRVVKMAAVCLTIVLILRADLDEVVGSVRGSPGTTAALMIALMNKLLIGVILISAAIAAIDFVWTGFDHRRKLRMTLQELRDETKEAEGDPMLKAKRRQRAQEIATNKMLAEVPRADVVIVNPTHYAVALAWTREPGSAPHCVAKGVDALAATIREIAAEAAVPIQHDPPTARSLYDGVEVGDEIPEELYRAVAAAIRFAEDMRRRARERSGPPL